MIVDFKLIGLYNFFVGIDTYEFR